MTRRGLYTPVILGSFPAFALAFRRGDISEATDAVVRVFDPGALCALKGTALSGEARSQGISTAEALGCDPLEFFAMRVVCSYSDTGAAARADASSAVDRYAKVIRNTAGELVWEYGKRIARLDAERIKAAAGFLSQYKKIRLGCVDIESENEFSVVAVVSLDGNPIEFSRTILIQAVTTERPFGFKASAGADGRIQDAGRWPFGVERVRSRVTIRLKPLPAGAARKIPEVFALDGNGYPFDEKVPATGGREGEPLAIRLSENSIYHIVKR